VWGAPWNAHRLGVGLDPSLSPAERDAVAAAVAAVDALPRLRLTLAVVPDPAAADIVFMDDPATLARAWALGLTSFAGGRAVCRLTALPLAGDGPQATLSVTEHELGHALGLAHWPGHPRDVMSPGANNFAVGYSRGDLWSLWLLYGRTKHGP
jgi:hypothetical protein